MLDAFAGVFPVWELLPGLELLESTEIADILLSDDPLEGLAAEVRGSDRYVNETIPLLLDQLAEVNATLFNFSEPNRALIQQTVRDSATGNLNSTEARASLEKGLANVTLRPDVVVAAVLGLNSTEETIAAIDSVLPNGANSTGVAGADRPSLISTGLAQAAFEELRTEFEELRLDAELLEDMTSALVEITEMPEVVKLRSDLGPNPTASVDNFSAVTDFVCPDAEAGTSIEAIPIIRQRRDAADVDVGNATVGASDAAEEFVSFRGRRSEQSEDTSSYATSTALSDITKSIIRLLENTSVYYAPNTSAEVNTLIGHANQTLEQLATMELLFRCVQYGLDNGTEMGGTNPINLDFWKGFPTEEALVEDGMYRSLSELIGGVVFYNVSTTGTLPKSSLEYSIRMNELKLPSTDK